MKIRGAWMVVVLLVIGFAVGFSASALTAERHPEIRRAQRFLGQAKNALEHAAHDYAGHRVKAIEHINEAEEELRQALESDRR